MSVPPNLSKPKVAVTGGGGFVGRALCSRLLELGYEVTSLARGDYAELRAKGVNTVRVDLSQPSDILEQALKDVQTVFHTAAKVEMWGKYDDFYQANVLGTRNLLELCKKLSIRNFIYTSSPSVISGDTDLINADESCPYPKSYLSYYAQTKAEAERMVLESGQSAALRTISLRPHLIFGPGDTSLTPAVLEKARRGKLLQVGDGKNLVDFTYIDDCVEAHICAMQALERDAALSGRAYFISQGDAVPLWGWINQVLERNALAPLKKRVPYKIAWILASFAELFARLKISGEPALTRFLVHQMGSTHYFNITRARRELGYKPRYSVAQALELTFAAEQDRSELVLVNEAQGNKVLLRKEGTKYFLVILPSAEQEFKIALNAEQYQKLTPASFQDPDKVEIERKWLVDSDSLPTKEALEKYKHSLIKQGFLAVENVAKRAARVRDENGVIFFTVKTGNGFSRSQLEIEFAPEQNGEKLFAYCLDRLNHKTRYYIPDTESDLINELDVFYGNSAGLVTVEREFKTENVHLASKKPNLLDGRIKVIADITDDFRYSNVSLALLKVPATS